MIEHPMMKGLARSLWALALALLLIGTSPSALAAEASASEQQARRLFESAEAHFKSGLFAEALAEYQSGYDIHPLPGFLINIAQCQRRLGKLSVARATYRKFIMVAPDSPFVPQVKALMAELDSLSQDLEGNETNDAKAIAPPQASDAAEARSEGAEPASAQVDTTAAVVMDTTPPTTAAEPKKTRWWLWGLIGAAAAGAVTTIVLVSLPPGTTTLHDGSLGTLRR
jgi:tetratricopeptide (TPR) repeat protein